MVSNLASALLLFESAYLEKNNSNEHNKICLPNLLNHHQTWFGWFDKLVSVSAETNEKSVLVLI
jgi:hypothetical protein